MEAKAKMEVKEIFTLSDGKNIFLGPVIGMSGIIGPGKWKLLVNQVEHVEVDITGEQIMGRRTGQSNYRALSTRCSIDRGGLDVKTTLIELVWVQ